MGIHVEEESVHAQGEVAVEQCLDVGRCLVPHAPHLRESFCLYDVFAIDMGSADGVKHIGRLVVSR